MQQGIIFDIKEFTVHDGPGIRTTVFMKGCPLHCLWCHNPEGIDIKRQIMITQNGCMHCDRCKQGCNHTECQGLSRCIKVCPRGLIKAVGQEVDASVLAGKLMEQSEFFDRSGVTISGGEPTMQPEFLFELLEGLNGIHTVVETCGHTSDKIFTKLIGSCTEVYLDIKHMNSSIHQKLTGVGNEQIQRNLDQLAASGRKFIVRVPLVPGLNDDTENLSELARRLKGVKGLKVVEFLPFNPFTGAKYVMAEMEYMLPGLDGNNYIPKIPEQLYKDMKVPFKVL